MPNKGDTDDLKNLAELREGDRRINVLAVAYTVTPPTATKGSQYMVKLELVEPSTPTIFTCFLFGDQEDLPDTSTFSHPAIVRLRKFNVNMFQDRAQLESGPGHSWSAFTNFGDSFVPEDKSHENTAISLTLAEQDKIMELREWIGRGPFNDTVFGKVPMNIVQDDSSENVPQQTTKFNKFYVGHISLENIENGLYFDTVLQVIGIHTNSKSIILRCIDGTRPSFKTFKTNSLYFESTLSQFIIAQLFDYYVDVTVYEEHQLTAEGVKIQDFVEFRNVHCYIPAALKADGLTLPEVILHKGHSFNRGIRILPRDQYPAVEPIALRINQLKLYSNPCLDPPDPPPYDPTSPPVTECMYPDQELTSLVDIIQNNTPQTLYHIRVFLDKYEPDNYPAFRRPFCGICQAYSTRTSIECRKCRSVDLSDELFFKLRVRDFSDGFDADVLCFAKNARYFLGVKDCSLLAVGEIEEVEKVVGRWCDLHVFSEECDGRVKIILADKSTIL